MTYKVSRLKDQKMIHFGRLVIRPLLPNVRMGSYNVLHEQLPGKTRLPMVRHRRTGELVYCLKGRFKVLLNKKEFSLRPGDIVWIPPGTWHTFITARGEARALSIFSPPLNFQKSPDVEVIANDR